MGGEIEITFSHTSLPIGEYQGSRTLFPGSWCQAGDNPDFLSSLVYRTDELCYEEHVIENRDIKDHCVPVCVLLSRGAVNSKRTIATLSVHWT